MPFETINHQPNGLKNNACYETRHKIINKGDNYEVIINYHSANGDRNTTTLNTDS
ncbi:hypothetical protein HpDR60_06770 [Helicobacter pylori]